MATWVGMEMLDGCEHIYNVMQLGHSLGPIVMHPRPAVDIYTVWISTEGKYLSGVDIYKV